ncbi:MAG: nitroreductase family protein [Candidatus Azobacteroides sp.]|nr:nitroreductase family protein [Candidatus Azobacteroides sp.]
MNFLDLVKKRFSLRNFSDRPVEREKIDYLLETARWAPSAVNYQPWYFIIIQEEEGKEKLRACYGREWFKTAPLYILICGDHEISWKRKDGKDFCDVDISIAVEHLSLAAAEQGLGSCWVCNFDAEKCKESFNLPAHIEPIVILPVGYPDEKAGLSEKERKRKTIDEITKWETF